MKYLTLIVSILLLSACGNQMIRPETQQYQGLSQAQYDYQSKNYNRSAQAYGQLYDVYQKDEFALYAADSWLQLGNINQTQRLLSRVRNTNHPLYQLLSAEIAASEDKFFNLESINGPLRERYLRIQSQMLERQHKNLDAALLLIELSEHNNDEDYASRIVNNLAKVPENQLTQSLFNMDLSRQQQGWLEAAYAANTNDSNAIEQWQNNWNNHPAQIFFNQSNNYSSIAVLLPLSGKYSTISKNIQQGMIASLYRDGANQQQITFFDTGSNGETFSYAWYGAIESGAKFIIGPLDKNSLNQMNQLNSATLPVLVLNQLGADENPNGFYQFSLSQEDEVLNVATRLIAENKKRIVLLVPESQKYQKLAKTFEEEYNYLGGQIVDYAFYPSKSYDYSREIKKILGLNQAKARKNKLQKLIGEELNFSAQIRSDVDAIFILAKPKQARQLKPQLKFFKAEKLPVFATSQIVPSKIDPKVDKDLDGIKFCQSQFTLNSKGLENALNFDPNKIKSHKKYFAFGYDAIALHSRVEWMQRMQNQKVQGLSGQLWVDGNGVVHRDLAWGQFKRGRPVSIPSIVIENDLKADETENLNE